MNSRVYSSRYSPGQEFDDPNLLLLLLGLALFGGTLAASQFGPPPLPDHWPAWAEVQTWPATLKSGDWRHLQLASARPLAAWLVWLLVVLVLGGRLLLAVALGGGDLHLAHTPRNVAWAALRRVVAAAILALLVGLPDVPPTVPSLRQLSVAAAGGDLPVAELVSTGVFILWLAWFWSSAIVLVRAVVLAREAVQQPRGRTAPARGDADPVSWRALSWLLVWLAASLWALMQLVGPPHLPRVPAEPPNWDMLLGLLRNPLPPFGTVIEVLGAAAWLGWLYLAGTLAFRLTIAGAVLLSHGAGWAQALWALSDRMSVPLVRQAVSFAFIASLVVRVPTVHAAAPPGVEIGAAASATEPPAEVRRVAQATPLRAPEEPEPAPEQLELLHVVRKGETLWSIARLIWGVGEDYPYLMEANRGRRMSDGRVFRGTQIYEGWVLRVPRRPNLRIETVNGRRYYTVVRGDTLDGIAARMLGDWPRWRDIFELNRNVARLPDGRTLTDPNLIWPGLRLQLPPDEADSAPAPAPADADETAPAAAVTEESAPAPAEPIEVPTTAPTPSPPPAEDRVVEATPVPTVTLEPTVVPSPLLPPEAAAGPTTSPTASTSPAASAPPDEVDPGLRVLWPPPERAIPAAGVAAGAALLAASVVAQRRRRGTSRLESETSMRQGFAEAVDDEVERYRHWAQALGEEVLAIARGQGCESLRLVGAYAGRTGVVLLLHVAENQTQILSEIARTFAPGDQAVRLKPWDARSTARPLDGDWRWEQAWTTLRPHLVPDHTQAPAVDLLPLGLAADRRILYVERAELGHVLIAGQDAADVHEVQASLVVDLARRQPPKELQFLTVARPERVEPLLADLPQQQVGFVDPADASAVAEVFARLDRELQDRLETGAASDKPDLVVVVDEWAELGDPGSVLDLLARHGPAVGIWLLAATTQLSGEQLGRWVDLFRTRLVLQVPDDTASARLLGEPNRAEDLDSGGELWPYLGGRILPPVRGFRVPTSHLQQLLGDMRRQLAREADRAAEPVSVAEPPELADVTSTDGDGASQERRSATETSDAAEPDASSRQLPLIKFVTLPQQTAAEAIPRLHIQVLDGHTALVDAQPVPEPRYRRAWEVLTVVACFPPGEAVRTRIVELVWPAAAEETGLTERQLDGRLRTAFAQLKDVWRAYVTPEEVDQLWHAQGGIIRLNERLVSVDLHAFLWAAQEGDRVWHAGPERPAEAIAAYRRALSVYTGPLLRGREQAYGWVRDFQDRYACRQRQVMHRLAELLMQSGRYAEAAPLWTDLMRDPGPPDPERDHEDQYAYREACARAAFECCRQLGDLGRLVRTHQELLTVLQALNADAEVAEAAEPEVQTTALFQQISAELASARTARP